MVPHHPRNTRPCMSDVAKAFFPKEYAQREQEREEVQRSWDKIRLNSVFPNTASPLTLLYRPLDEVKLSEAASAALRELDAIPADQMVQHQKALVPVLGSGVDLRPWWKKFPQQ